MDNNVHLVGTIESDIVFSHKTGNEVFNTFKLAVQRDSGKYDDLNMVASEKTTAGLEFKVGDRVEINGQCRVFRTRNTDGTRNKELYTFVTEINKCESDIDDLNEVEISGELAKCYQCRNTKYTNRELIEFTLQVARNYGKCDWINCVAWGRDAKYLDRIVKSEGIEKIAEKERFNIKGRLQSRTYRKRVGEDEYRDIETFELSVIDLKSVPKAEETVESEAGENENS